MPSIDSDDPLAQAVTTAIRAGDLATLQTLLAEHPSLVHTSIEHAPSATSRTLLHIATDWPGHYPAAAATVAALVAAGADPNARFKGGPHTETPLHWAASSDDVAVLDALLDAGADIEARGGVIGGGTALADATAFGQWEAARRLVERGARATLWEAAALGLIDRVKEHFANEPTPTQDDVTHAFWGACHGGQQTTAKYLLERGADINLVGHDDLTPLDAAARSEAPTLVRWLRDQGAVSAAER
jgi:uncharacterized protein